MTDADGSPHVDVDVVIVGAGPRAISLLEWLDRLVPHSQTSALKVVVLDPYPPGGRVWRVDQSPCLLMNTIAGESTVFADASVAGVDGPVGPTLFRWAADLTHDPALPAWIREEAAALRPEDYASRRLFGVYLASAFAEISQRLRPRVDVHHHPGTVHAVVPENAAQRVELADGSHVSTRLVICLPGHTRVQPTPAERALSIAARRQGLLYGPPSHPTETPVDPIKPREPVALRGLALNFHDTVAMLTVGRGGSFGPHRGALAYHPSGAEPVLYCGSRRGIPQYSRIDSASWKPTFRVFTEELIDELHKRGPDVDAARDLFPLITKEALLAYYGRLAELHPSSERTWAQLVQDLSALTPDTPDWTAAIESATTACTRLTSLEELADPLEGKTFTQQSDLDTWMVDHLTRDVTVTERPDQHARAAIPIVLRDLRWRLSGLFGAGGVSGASYARDVDGWMGELMRTISNGPPTIRNRQLIALNRAGVLHFIGGTLRITVQDGAFRVVSGNLTDWSLATRAVLDCYVQRQDVRRTDEPLLRQLLSERRIRASERVDSVLGDAMTQIGAVDVALGSGQVVATDGSVDATLQFGGIPLEGLRWNTALAGRAGVNSEFFQETGALAMAALATLGIRTPTKTPNLDQSISKRVGDRLGEVWNAPDAIAWPEPEGSMSPVGLSAHSLDQPEPKTGRARK